jgi:hypothetical protein
MVQDYDLFHEFENNFNALSLTQALFLSTPTKLSLYQINNRKDKKHTIKDIVEWNRAKANA